MWPAQSAAGKPPGTHPVPRSLLAALALAAMYATLLGQRALFAQHLAWGGLELAAFRKPLPSSPQPVAGAQQQQQQQQQQLLLPAPQQQVPQHEQQHAEPQPELHTNPLQEQHAEKQPAGAQQARRAEKHRHPDSQQAQRQLPLNLTASSAVHGRLVKAGPQAALAAIAGGSSACDLSYWHGCPWTEQRLAGNAPPFPSKWCATLYNDKYRLIFLKCPKTAGTALLRQFKVCGFGNTTDRCLKFVDVNNATEVQHVVSKWQDYFVFGFSRNILARAVSQYRYLAHFVNADWPLSSWDEFCADPFVLGDMALQAHAAGKDCCSQSAEHQYVHVLPQAHCFTTANKQPALDWLGRVEHYEKDIRELFQLLNCRPGVPRLPLLLPLSHLNSAPPTQCTQRHRSRRLLGSGRGGGGTAGPTFQPRNDTFNPCNELDYFRGPHTHCYTDLMRFHAEDVSFLHGRQP